MTGTFQSDTGGTSFPLLSLSIATNSFLFLQGKCVCPPDDCGGVWGYQDLIEILEKRKARKRLNAEDMRRLEWVGWDADYDPGELDLKECRRIVEEYNT